MSSKIYKFYSIIVPSFNRADEIKELLDSVELLNFPFDGFEVIIVDDGSTDTTGSYLKEYQRKTKGNFSYCTQINQGPGVARNTGMENAKGDFFIFIDSDCSVPSDWLKEIDIKLNETSSESFGGPDSYKEDFSPLLKAINYSMTSFLTTGGMRGKKGTKLAKFYPRSFNMGISRTLWKKIGGFGSLRHGQDIEFSNRIIKSGVKPVFIEDAFVYHKRRTNFRRFLRQVFNWGVARINLYKFDPSMLEPLHTLPALVTLLIIMISILALFLDVFRWILFAGLIIFILILIYSIFDSIRIYRQFKPAILLILIIPAQIFGYGFGFIYNFFRRVILNKKEKVGFKKTYYK